jgi:hypothetical protein
MATVSAIRQGLAERANTIPGLRAYPTVLDQMNTPCLFVFGPERIRYDSTMARGSDEFTFPLRLYVARVDEKGAQDRLDAYCSPIGDQSVKAAIEADASLGGRVDFADVREARNYGPYQSGQVTYLGVEFNVFVIARP